MTKKSKQGVPLYVVHRGIEFQGERVEAGSGPVALTGWPPNVIEHWLKVGVLSVSSSVSSGKEAADVSGTAG